MAVTLRGLTWDHARGYDPLVAASAAYRRTHPDVQIVWEKRPLQAFADAPIDRLAAAYDLLVIDHPHAGAAASDACLAPLDDLVPPSALAALATLSVGRSHDSYRYGGHQWALAIDAAAQVAAYRPDLLGTPPISWADVLALAREGRVLWPIKPVDALSSFFTVAANRGTPGVIGETRLLAREDALEVLETLRVLAALVPEVCLAMNPIQALDELSTGDRYAYSPLLFGYSNYARHGFRPHLLRFANIPSPAGTGSAGALLGGAGLAVSARCAAREQAVDYALWLAGAECQRGIYVQSGGQPAHLAAWNDAAADALCNGFFRDTRATLDGVWIRPRYNGYLAFQERGGALVNRFLAGGWDAGATVDGLDVAFRATAPREERQG